MSWEFIREITCYIAATKQTNPAFERKVLEYTQYAYPVPVAGIPFYSIPGIYKTGRNGCRFYCDQPVYRLAGWDHRQGFPDADKDRGTPGFLG